MRSWPSLNALQSIRHLRTVANDYAAATNTKNVPGDVSMVSMFFHADDVFSEAPCRLRKLAATAKIPRIKVNASIRLKSEFTVVRAIVSPPSANERTLVEHVVCSRAKLGAHWQM